MHTVVQQALGHVHGVHPKLLGFFLVGHDKFMGGSPSGVSQLKTRLGESGRHIVRIQGGVLAHSMHTLATKQQGIGQGSQQYARVAGEAR